MPVFQAEIYAILQCAKSDDLRQRHDDSIAICTDSMAALKALSSPKVTSALVSETMAALRELAILIAFVCSGFLDTMEYQATIKLTNLQSKHQPYLTSDLNRSLVLLIPLCVTQ